jgi:hypothetical protein
MVDYVEQLHEQIGNTDKKGGWGLYIADGRFLRNTFRCHCKVSAATGDGTAGDEGY